MKIIFVFFSFWLRRCAGYEFAIEMLADVRDHFSSSWVIVQCCTKTDYATVEFSKAVQRSTNAYISAYVWEDFAKSVNLRDDDRSFKPMVFISCRSCSRDCYAAINQIADESVTAKFIWLAILNDTSPGTSDVINVPVDTLFIAAVPDGVDSFALSEVYRIAKDSRVVERRLGTWSLSRGLDMTSASLEERRSDFMGKTVVTLVEPEDSLNRLLAVYNYYALSYLDLSKRLNFSVENVTNPKAAFEVSILPQWIDREDDLVYLQPLYTSWQSIFFKDVGTSMQLGGYLKPFRSDVWLAVISVTLATGVASYVAARALHRATDRRRSELRFENYIYQSFYILLQKSEEGTAPFVTARIIALSQWLVSIFLLSCYSAIFISFISVVIPKPPFTTIDEILHQRSHNIVQSKHISSAAVDFLKHSGDAKLRRLYENHFDPRRNLMENAVDVFCESQNYLFITSEIHIRKVRASSQYRNCAMSSTRIRLSLRHLSWSLKNTSRMTRFFKLHLSKLHLAGALQSSFIRRQTYGAIPESDPYRRMNLKDVLFLFLILLTGLFISLLMLVLEIVHKEK